MEGEGGRKGDMGRGREGFAPAEVRRVRVREPGVRGSRSIGSLGSRERETGVHGYRSVGSLGSGERVREPGDQRERVIREPGISRPSGNIGLSMPY